ncbi:MAG: hypothetical protein WC829_15740 [Hyphomicrobium sp.]|jgi:hypothetical protein
MPLLPDALVGRLIARGGWVSREALCKGMKSSTEAIDDALADLVMERRIEYREAVGYRLAGTVLTRQAAKTLRANGLLKAVCGRQVGDEYHVGVAQAHQSLGLVMYEMTMPMADTLDGHIEQVNALAKFTEGVL